MVWKNGERKTIENCFSLVVRIVYGVEAGGDGGV